MKGNSVFLHSLYSPPSPIPPQKKVFDLIFSSYSKLFKLNPPPPFPEARPNIYPSLLSANPFSHPRTFLILLTPYLTYCMTN